MFQKKNELEHDVLGLRDEIAALEAEIGEVDDVQVRCGSCYLGVYMYPSLASAFDITKV